MQQRHRDRDDPDVVKEIEVETPIGKLAAKGIRISDIGMFFTMCAIGYLIAILSAHTVDAKEAMSDHTKAIRAMTRAQNLTTCIMVVPMEQRKKEFSDPNSFCRRMAELP